MRRVCLVCVLEIAEYCRLGMRLWVLLLVLCVPGGSAPARTIGIGLAVRKDVLDLSELSGSIPVRLSSFTTEPVCVDYAVDADNECYAAGTLCFVPGETLKHIQFGLPPIGAVQWLDVSLSNPTNAELMGHSTVTYHSMLAEPLVLAGD